MRYKGVVCFGIITLFTVACQNTSNINHSATIDTNTIDTSQIECTSLINLIATPKRFNGRKVRVTGYLHLEFEDCVLCLNKEDYTHSINKNAVWADIKTKVNLRKLHKFSDHYVVMEGIFNSTMKGNEALNSGAIQNISRLDVLK